MPRRERRAAAVALHPVPMQRVALLAPQRALRPMLVRVADSGTVDLNGAAATDGGHATDATPAELVLQRLPGGAAVAARVSPSGPDLDAWERAARADLIAGEAALERRSAAAVTHGRVAAIVGWMPVDDVPALADTLAETGAAVVPLPGPKGTDPPTLLAERGTARDFAPLVETYATVPYRDVNPSTLAGIAYVAMFGMMFADVGHGALLLAAAAAVRWQWWSRLARLRPVWRFLAGAGASSMLFGALYGEFFGPSHVVPVLWLAPLSHPVPLLGAAVGVGAVLLAAAYALGTANRFREGGWTAAVYSPSGLAGASVFLGLGVVAGGLYWAVTWLVALGTVVAAVGLVVAYVGLFAAAGGRAAGGAQAAIELFDLVVRLGSNLVSFARLAAFGLTHAALGAVVWDATSALWRHGSLAVVAAVVVFLAGNALAFALEGLVAAVQALRLEYYELFSRVFDGVGRPYRPWHVPLDAGAVPATTEALS